MAVPGWLQRRYLHAWGVLPWLERREEVPACVGSAALAASSATSSIISAARSVCLKPLVLGITFIHTHLIHTHLIHNHLIHTDLIHIGFILLLSRAWTDER